MQMAAVKQQNYSQLATTKPFDEIMQSTERQKQRSFTQLECSTHSSASASACHLTT